VEVFMTVAETNKANLKNAKLNEVKTASSFTQRVIKDFKRNKYLYLMVIPVIGFYIVFHYLPMYGAIISFKDYNPGKGIIGSEWVGFKHFLDFFNSYHFWRVLRNTLLISVYSIIFGFPAPIILALLINELRNKAFKKTVQTISYLPHFISLVVICGMITDFTSRGGIISNFLVKIFGFPEASLLQFPEYFRTIYISSNIWQEVGWGSIIYLAALTGIDVQLYEAAKLDGANRWRQLIHITLPGIMSTIVIMLILKLGSIMNIGFEKVILLYNPTIYETADIISSFVYRKGLLEFGWSFSSAVGLFNSLINCILLISANWISRKLTDTSLW